MKKLLKIIGVFFGVLLLAGVFWGILVNESLPEGSSGVKADALAHKMLNTLNHKKYEDTRFLHWSFRNGAHQYQWDKKSGVCEVKWDDYEVILNLVHPELSQVDGAASITEKEKLKLIQKAEKMFNNDSFWLVATYKVFDQGTTRSLIELENGIKGLMVTYSSGGNTPGDSYLWLLNDDGFPQAFKMWVKILPIGGIEASWNGWIVTESGAYLPKNHKVGPLTLNMGDVKGFNP